MSIRIFRIIRTVRRGARIGARAVGQVNEGVLPTPDISTAVSIFSIAGREPRLAAALLALLAIGVGIGAGMELIHPTVSWGEMRRQTLTQIYGSEKADEIIARENNERVIELDLQQRQS